MSHLMPNHQSLGLRTLKRAISDVIKNLPKNERFAVYDDFEKLKHKEHDCYIFPFIHQNDRRNSICLEEAYCWNQLNSLISQGLIFLRYIPVPSWAMSNNGISEIDQWDIDGMDIKTDTSNISDGYVYLKKDLTLIELTHIGERELSGLNKKTLIEGQYVHLEVGTNSLIKFYASLALNSRVIARIPYHQSPWDLKSPTMAIFASYKGFGQFRIG